MTDHYSGPCRTCESTEVTVVRQKGQASLTDEVAPVELVRECGNPSCPTNNPRERGMLDVV